MPSQGPSGQLVQLTAWQIIAISGMWQPCLQNCRWGLQRNHQTAFKHLETKQELHINELKCEFHC